MGNLVIRCLNACLPSFHFLSLACIAAGSGLVAEAVQLHLLLVYTTTAPGVESGKSNEELSEIQSSRRHAVVFSYVLGVIGILSVISGMVGASSDMKSRSLSSVYLVTSTSTAIIALVLGIIFLEDPGSAVEWIHEYPGKHAKLSGGEKSGGISGSKDGNLGNEGNDVGIGIGYGKGLEEADHALYVVKTEVGIAAKLLLFVACAQLIGVLYVFLRQIWCNSVEDGVDLWHESEDDRSNINLYRRDSDKSGLSPNRLPNNPQLVNPNYPVDPINSANSVNLVNPANASSMTQQAYPSPMLNPNRATPSPVGAYRTGPGSTSSTPLTPSSRMAPAGMTPGGAHYASYATYSNPFGHEFDSPSADAPVRSPTGTHTRSYSDLDRDHTAAFSNLLGVNNDEATQPFGSTRKSVGNTNRSGKRESTGAGNRSVSSTPSRDEIRQGYADTRRKNGL